MNWKSPGPGLHLSWAALVCVGMWFSGCCSFDRAWKEAKAIPATGMEGRWKGTWLSHHNGHSGPLRCLIESEEEELYRARFHAQYKRFLIPLSFGYTVPLKVQESGDGKWEFEGTADLGWLAGGTYEYAGHATTNEFYSTYRSKHDHGIFEMGRVD